MRASKRHGVSVNEDGTLTGVDGVRRCLLRVPGLPLDAHAEPEQDRYAYLFGALAASLPHKARLAVFIENRPADAMALVAGLRAQLAPVPYTPQLGELGDRMLAWWARRLRGDACGQRHVATLDYWLLIDPWPAREGFPDTSDGFRLQHAVDALTRQLVAMGIPPTRVDVATARAFVARHLDRQDAGVARDARGESVIYTAPSGEESIHAYRTIDRRTGEERWRRTLYLVQPPVTTSPGWLRPLVASDSPATIVIHLRGLKRSWERRRQAWRLKVMAGTRTSADITTGLAATEAEEQATALHQQGYGISNVGLYVRLEGATRAQLDSRVGGVLMALRDGMIAEPGYGHAHQRPLYRSTLPGYGNAARSTYRWDSVTWGQAFPFMTFNPGTRTLGCPLGTTEAAGDLVTLALDDPNLYNRVGVILGRVGTGKTSLLQKLALHFLLRGDMATVVSSVDSFRALCAISGGQRATLGGTASATLNVWTSPHDTEEERREGVRFVCAAIDLLLGGLTDLEPAVIDEAVRAVYAAATDRVPVMSDLYHYLDSAWRAPSCDADDKKVYRGLAWKLRPYIGDGQYAQLVDGTTSVDLTVPLLAFNTEPLEDTPALRSYALFSVFAIVDQRRALARARSQQQGRSSADHLTGLDEAWGLLTSPLAREYLNRDARKARHGGNCVVFASQQVKDLVGNPEAETFFTQAVFKALFSIEDNGQATQGNPRLWLQRLLNLTEQEVEQAQRMAGQKGRYMPAFLTRRDRGSPRDLHGVVHVELTPEEALLFASDVDDLQAREWYAQQAGGDVWEGIKWAIDGAPGSAEEVSA